MENKYYEMNIAGCIRRLPLIRITDGMEIASFVLLGDAQLVVKAADELVKRIPKVDYLITAEAKGIPLVQEMARVLGMDRYFVARMAALPTRFPPAFSTRDSMAFRDSPVLITSSTIRILFPRILLLSSLSRHRICFFCVVME